MHQTIVALTFFLPTVQAPAPRADLTPPAGTTITVAELAPRHALGTVLVIDVRTTVSFESGHIAGAIGVPLDQIERRAPEIRKQSKGRLVVTYCSCPTEHASLAAAEALRARGITALALAGGYPAWVDAGGRTERKPHRTLPPELSPSRVFTPALHVLVIPSTSRAFHTPISQPRPRGTSGTLPPTPP